VAYPIIYRVSTIQGDAGFLPSTVAIEAMAIEIVDFPIFPLKMGGSFHSYVNVYQRVILVNDWDSCNPPIFISQH